jgi:iron-sulfur cluster assembly protein
MRQTARSFPVCERKPFYSQSLPIGTQSALIKAIADKEKPMIQLTDAAAGALHSALSSTAVPMAGLRLAARSVGCAGLRYEMGLVEKADPADASWVSQGVKILIDPSSVALIAGTTIDLIDNEEGIGFSFDNPNAQSKGGCGKSCC